VSQLGFCSAGMWYDSNLDDETNTLLWNNKRQSPREMVPHSRRMEISRFKGSFNGYIRTIITFPSPHFGICWVTYLMLLSLLRRATRMFKGRQGVSSLSFRSIWVQKTGFPKTSSSITNLRTISLVFYALWCRHFRKP